MVTRGAWREAGLLLAGCALLPCLVLTSSAQAKSSNQKLGESPSIEIPQARVSTVRRDISLEDMVSVREVHEPRASPDGRHVAFLVKQAFLKCDCYRTALYVVSSDGKMVPRKVLEESELTHLQWSPDGRFLTYLSAKSGSLQLWRVNPGTRKATEIFFHTPNRDRTTGIIASQGLDKTPTGVGDYRWSPDGKKVAFITDSPANPLVVADASKNGFRYDEATMLAWDLMVGDWAMGHRSRQLWMYDVSKRSESVVWEAPSEWSTRFTTLLWSPSGKSLAFLYTANGDFGSDAMGIVDAVSLKVSSVGAPADHFSYSSAAAWSADEHSIAYLARSSLAGLFSLAIANVIDHTTRELYRGIYPGHPSWLEWDHDRHRLNFISEGLGQDQRQTGLYSIADDGGQPNRLTSMSEKFSECDVIVKQMIACVNQSPSIPPGPVLVSLENDSVKILADVNPEMAALRLAPVKEIHWQNEYGDPTNGFLILPPHTAPGERVPLVLMGYSFSGEFVTQASEVLSTYPAQAFAKDGVAVLLLNYPRFEDWPEASFDKGSRAVGYGPLSSIQKVIRQLDDEGLIDPTRVGMMGHSWSGFWVQLAITKTNIFKVVEIHNGGTASEPGTYWKSGSKQQRELQEHIMGGPPYDETLENYKQFSMTLNAGRIRAPVLMEYDATEAIDAMEYYEAMQYYHVPLEFFVYPGDGHVTRRPAHRLVSLQRNLDWFEFWLLGRENDASTKNEQYARWRQLELQVAKRNAVDPPK